MCSLFYTRPCSSFLVPLHISFFLLNQSPCCFQLLHRFSFSPIKYFQSCTTSHELHHRFSIQRKRNKTSNILHLAPHPPRLSSLFGAAGCFQISSPFPLLHVHF
ncbi:hypothetical protein VIGAN_07202100 [Vigna angularis var. angularis]|uniref:Uncharacterized protein n=1 Tax=Vigna angularis var. angularis TaxID=157739 RepID=A0A0S3SJZ6_PHAAN|nr:hypothetical protein VIGAN_07202100 [Vigna angularis var. angularis]